MRAYRDVIGLLRAGLSVLAWELAEDAQRHTGIPALEILRRAWGRVIGVRYRRPCQVGRCVRTAIHRRAWCEEHAPEIARVAA